MLAHVGAGAVSYLLGAGLKTGPDTGPNIVLPSWILNALNLEGSVSARFDHFSANPSSANGLLGAVPSSF